MSKALEKGHENTTAMTLAGCFWCLTIRYHRFSLNTSGAVAPSPGSTVLKRCGAVHVPLQAA